MIANSSKGFKKTGRKHKDIKKQWSNKMQQLKKEKAASLTKEKKKLKDPDYLKAQTQPSAFSLAENANSHHLVITSTLYR